LISGRKLVVACGATCRPSVLPVTFTPISGARHSRQPTLTGQVRPRSADLASFGQQSGRRSARTAVRTRMSGSRRSGRPAVILLRLAAPHLRRGTLGCTRRSESQLFGDGRRCWLRACVSTVSSAWIKPLDCYLNAVYLPRCASADSLPLGAATIHQAISARPHNPTASGCYCQSGPLGPGPPSHLAGGAGAGPGPCACPRGDRGGRRRAPTPHGARATRPSIGGQQDRPAKGPVDRRCERAVARTLQ
jgi:hypothetical protein